MACDRFIVLCEDRRHESFVRSWLIKCGVDKRCIRVKPAPLAKGSAENYVREKYPGEVRILRSKANQQNLGLIAVIDGDKLGFIARKKQLDEALVAADMTARSHNEQICIFAPTRNIETWVYCLIRKSIVDEKTDYKHQVSSENVKVAGHLFRSSNFDQQTLSLKDATVERARVGY